MTTTAEQRRTFRRALLDEFYLRVGGDTYDIVVTAGALHLRRNSAVLRRVDARVWRVRLDRDAVVVRLAEQAAEDYLDATGEHLLGALIVAAIAGHPDEEKENQGVHSELWTPHFSVALGADPRTAETKTQIGTPSRELAELHHAGVELIKRADQAPDFDLTIGSGRFSPYPTSSRDRPRHEGDEVIDIPVRRASREGYERWSPKERQTALNREAALVDAFCAFLERQDRRFTSKRIPSGSRRIECDIFDETRRILFEAKADENDRSQIRMAIGQLFDYAYHGFGEIQPRLAVLLPASPTQDIAELLWSLQIGLAWRTQGGLFAERYFGDDR